MENKFIEGDASGLAFMGKIASNATHEMNNVLSIIGEYAGVIEDKIHAALNGADFDIEKVLYCKEKIDNQISRGRSLNKELNKFSHSVDEKISTFDLSGVVESMILLTNRFAASKLIKLSFAKSGEDFTVRGNLFEIERKLFLLIYFVPEVFSKGAEIEFTVNRSNDSGEIIADCRGPENAGKPALQSVLAKVFDDVSFYDLTEYDESYKIFFKLKEFIEFD